MHRIEGMVSIDTSLSYILDIGSADMKVTLGDRDIDTTSIPAIILGFDMTSILAPHPTPHTDRVIT